MKIRNLQSIGSPSDEWLAKVQPHVHRARRELASFEHAIEACDMAQLVRSATLLARAALRLKMLSAQFTLKVPTQRGDDDVTPSD